MTPLVFFIFNLLRLKRITSAYLTKVSVYNVSYTSARDGSGRTHILVSLNSKCFIKYNLLFIFFNVIKVIENLLSSALLCSAPEIAQKGW